MNYPDYDLAKQSLLHTINICAPTGADQRAAVKLLHDIEDAGEQPVYCLRALTSYLLDGLAYSNWPSCLAKLTGAKHND